MIVLKLDKIASQRTLTDFNQNVKRILSGQTRYVLGPLERENQSDCFVVFLLLFCFSLDVSYL